MISNRIYMPANSKYFPKNTSGPEPVSQKRPAPESREGAGVSLGRQARREHLPSAPGGMHGLKPSQEKNLSRDGEYAGEWRERERAHKKSVSLFTYLPDSHLPACSARATSLPDTQQRRIPGVISASSPGARVASQFPSCIPVSA